MVILHHKSNDSEHPSRPYLSIRLFVVLFVFCSVRPYLFIPFFIVSYRIYFPLSLNVLPILFVFLSVFVLVHGRVLLRSTVSLDPLSLFTCCALFDDIFVRVFFRRYLQVRFCSIGKSRFYFFWVFQLSLHVRKKILSSRVKRQ